MFKGFVLTELLEILTTLKMPELNVCETEARWLFLKQQHQYYHKNTEKSSRSLSFLIDLDSLP